MTLTLPSSQMLLVDYVNWRGERSTRRVTPNRLIFGSNEWHPQPQWLLECWDVDKQEDRSFALKDCNFRIADGAA